MRETEYEALIEEIQGKRRFGTSPGVELSAKLLERLGHPEKGMRFVHIAGTNGKGSVSAFLCQVFEETGLKTGMFTSPHLIDFRERIQINGVMIPKEDVYRIGKYLLDLELEESPTMFDLCLAMAVLYYQEQQCQVVVIETGLGGRLDSTNALGIPEVTVITKIGYDHMAILGDTLPAIAAEKAGIIKSGTRLVLESQEPEVMEVLLKAASQAGVTEVSQVERKDIIPQKTENFLSQFSFRSYENLSMQMLGVHQYENAAAAILAAEAYGIPKGHPAIARGIAKTVWPGRMEVLCRQPLLILDGAHNDNGVEALKNSLEGLFPGEKFHFIMGVMADKDYEAMIEDLIPLALDFHTVTVENDRALMADTLAECIRKRGIPANSCQNLEQCFGSWENPTVVFGSLYFVGEVKAFFLEHPGKDFD